MVEIALSLIISYLVGNVPTIKNWLESNKTLYDRLNNCYKKAVSQWNVPAETQKMASEQMEKHLQHLRDYIVHKPVGRHPKENELLKLWADCILSDSECYQFIEMHQHEIMSLKLDENLLTANEILEDIKSISKELVSIKEIITKLANRGLQTCSQFWDSWATGKDIVLNYDIILSGRDDCKKRIWDTCDNPNVLYIEAISSKEAMAFAVASIITSGELNENRTIIVSKTDVLKEMLEDTDNLIIITDSLDNVHQASFKSHTIICCVCPTANLHVSDLMSLPFIDRNGFISSLKKSGIDSTKATQLAVDTARDVNVLRHLLGIETSNPSWFTPSNIQILIPALLIGEWDEKCVNDRELVAKFARIGYPDYVKQSYFFVTRRWSTHNKDRFCLESKVTIRFNDPFSKLYTTCSFRGLC